MATSAHCAYCFEILSANLEKRKPLNLVSVEELWAAYESANEAEDTDETGAAAASGTADLRPAAISRLLAASPSTASSSSAPSASSSTPSLIADSSPATSATSVTSKSSGKSSLFSLSSRLGRGKRRSRDASEEYPLFVTWDTRSRSGNKSLRGCIGTFEAQELDDGLRSYALTSALDDSRFMPVTLREVPTLECSVTLLTDFEPVSDPMDWDLNKHGLRINFTSNSRRYGSTYLPDVAREQGWTKEETMISLMRKAGWNGRSSEWNKVPDLKVVRYQGRKSALSYKEWREWRDWVEETGRDEMDL